MSLDIELVLRRYLDLVSAERFHGGLLKERGWKGEGLSGSVLLSISLWELLLLCGWKEKRGRDGDLSLTYFVENATNTSYSEGK